MHKFRKINIYILVFLILPDIPALAYIGPGMGGGFLTAILGIVVAIFAVIFGTIWFPIKRFLNKKKTKKKK